LEPERWAAHGKLVLDRSVQLGDEAVGEGKEADKEAPPVHVPQEARADERVQQQLFEARARAYLKVDRAERATQRACATDVGVGRVGAESAHEHVRDRLRHEPFARRPLAAPPLLAHAHDCVLQSGRLIAVELENHVMQRGTDVHELRRDSHALRTDGAANQRDDGLKLADGACGRPVSAGRAVVPARRDDGLEEHVYARSKRRPQLLHLAAARRLQCLGQIIRWRLREQRNECEQARARATNISACARARENARCARAVRRERMHPCNELYERR